MASTTFGIEVKDDTLQKMKRENRVMISRPGPVGKVSDEELECIEDTSLLLLINLPGQW